MPAPATHHHQLTWRMRFGPDERSVGLLRREVRRVLDDMACSADDAATILVVCSELITNAIRHAPCPETGLAVTCGDGVVLIEVEDGSADPPVPQRHLVDAESGRGLDIVRSLASEWGWTPHEGGTKTTWALIPVLTKQKEEEI